MYAKKLRLFSFRNIPYADIELSEGINFFLGDNAQGKTNALEAIYLFARGKSFRGARDSEMAAFGSDGFSAELTFEKSDREETLFYGWSKKERIRKRNGIPLEKQSELLGHFRAVLFSPDHLQMVKGSPSERRRFLDIAISQCYPVYLGLYAYYGKILENRNALLKDMQKRVKSDTELLSVYSEKLAHAAAEIYLYRRRYVAALHAHAESIMKELSEGKEQMALSYQSDIGFLSDVHEDSCADPAAIPSPDVAESAYASLLSGNTEREIMAGTTLYGVHRDELQISLCGINARDYGSQGQQRSAVLSLKMAEGQLSKEICGENPVYLFDDVLSELDEGRRGFLLSGMKGCQFIVTGCERSVLGAHADHVRFISVKNGTFEG